MSIDVDCEGRIHAIIDNLVRERRRLQEGGAERPLIEASTRAIAYWHDQLRRRDAALSSASVAGPIGSADSSPRP